MSAQPIAPAAIQTADDAVEAIWQAVFAGSYPDVSAAARSLWATFDLAPHERDFLVIFGLSELAKQRQHSSHQRSGRPAIGFGSPHGKKWAAYIALTWPYESADGSQKPLLDFGPDDLAAFALSAAKMVDAYTRRRTWASETSALLEEHRASRVRDLPRHVLANVNTAALEAMGRQQQ